MLWEKKIFKEYVATNKKQIRSRKGQFVVNDRELFYLLRDKQVNFVLSILSDWGSVPVKFK